MGEGLLDEINRDLKTLYYLFRVSIGDESLPGYIDRNKIAEKLIDKFLMRESAKKKDLHTRIFRLTRTGKAVVKQIKIAGYFEPFIGMRVPSTFTEFENQYRTKSEEIQVNKINVEIRKIFFISHLKVDEISLLPIKNKNITIRYQITRLSYDSEKLSDSEVEINFELFCPKCETNDNLNITVDKYTFHHNEVFICKNCGFEVYFTKNLKKGFVID